MKKKKIFIIGGDGLVGSRVTELLNGSFTFANLSYATGVDITKPETMDSVKTDNDHSIVIHMAAKTDVDGCEKDKHLGEKGDAYRINVSGTQNVVEVCKKSQKKIIYISTDFIFNGENTPVGGYTEDDKPDPLNWYARTKYLGEEIIKNSGLPFLIIRIAYPFRKQFELKNDFVRAIIARLRNGQPIAGVTDHIFCPTYIDDIASALQTLIITEATGVYHVTGSQSLSPFNAALQIAEVFNLDNKLITQTTRVKFFKDRAPRPFDLTINNDKIEKLGVKMNRFDEALHLLL